MTLPSPTAESAQKTEHPPALNRIAILDCGAQYTKVIDRRVRECHVGSDIFPLAVPADTLRGQYAGIILSGGPNSVYDANAPQCDPAIFELGIPVLGICYGMQLMAQTLGGKVIPGTTKEYGQTDVVFTQTLTLFDGWGKREPVLMSHGDKVDPDQLPAGFTAVGYSAEADHTHTSPIIAVMADTTRHFYGVQFHPEVELTPKGGTLLNTFLKTTCACPGTFTLDTRLDDLLHEIRTRVKDENVFVLVSGGVDSSVTAALLLKALGPERVYALHMDSGLMRHDESDLVCDALQALGLKHLTRLNAANDFFNATTDIDGQIVGPLCQTTNPEHKRRIIGDVFFRLTEQAMRDAACNIDTAFIAQGTLRPDLIESGNREVSATAHTIKTHHNDVPIIQAHRAKGLIIEPNRDLHKDEVRELGQLLGLPEALVARQPFPGPGLGIRVLCTERPFLGDNYPTLQTQLAQHVTQADPALQALVFPVQSVGVQGDGRTYNHLAIVNAPANQWDSPLLPTLARTIPNTLHAINRVALWLGASTDPTAPLPKSCTTITPTTLTPETVAKLRQADHIVSTAFQQAGVFQHISQLLAVLVPVDFENRGRHCIAIRAVITSDYMTARPALPGQDIPCTLLQSIATQLNALDFVAGVMLDLTAKPPATVEWE